MRFDEENDITKKMLNRLRSLNEDDQHEENDAHKKNDRNDNGVEDSSEDVIAISDSPDFGDKILSKHKSDIKTGLGCDVEFGKNCEKYYPKSGEITFEGNVKSMGNMHFQFRLNDPSGKGCYVWCEPLQLNDDNAKNVSKLFSLFTVWQQWWIENKSILDNR